MNWLLSLLKAIMALAVLFTANTTSAQTTGPDSSLAYHTVQLGENLYRISLKYNVTMAQVMNWNGITKPNALKAGQVLKIWQKKSSEGIDVKLEVIPEELPEPEPEEEIWKDTKPVRIKRDTLAVAVRDTPPPQKPITTNPLTKPDSVKQAENEQLIFSSTRIAPKEEEFDTTGTIDISGYISAYYSHYSDSVGYEHYQKFPTQAPVSDKVGINLLQISAKYKSEKIRGIITLHWGDMPQSAWSSSFNFIQQANLGIRIFKRWWFDMGYFRTHFGLESVQPRENINSSMALTTFFEPYYLTGAKLTWQATSKLVLQVNTFSQFNGFTENNRDKAVGFSALYDFSPKLSMTFNTMTSDDAPDGTTSKRRLYNDFYLVYKSKRIILGFEFNYGRQQNSGIQDTAATAHMLGSLLAVKYKVNKKFAVYTRGEYFNDKDGMLGGLYVNHLYNPIGLNIWGIDGGIEIKPIPNSYVRFEYRRLTENSSSGDIFYYNGQYRTFRNEFIFSTGFWF